VLFILPTMSPFSPLFFQHSNFYVILKQILERVLPCYITLKPTLTHTHTHTHANRHRSGQSVGRPALSFYPTTADQRCWPRYQHEQQRQQRLLKREKQEKLHKRRPQQFSTLLIRGFQRIKRAAMRFVVE